jgi:hypothetical protein
MTERKSPKRGKRKRPADVIDVEATRRPQGDHDEDDDEKRP